MYGVILQPSDLFIKSLNLCCRTELSRKAKVFEEIVEMGSYPISKQFFLLKKKLKSTCVR